MNRSTVLTCIAGLFILAQPTAIPADAPQPQPPGTPTPSPAELYNRGRLAEAASAAQAELKNAPDNPDLHLLLGRSLADLERFEDARAPLAKVLLLDSRGTWRSAWALGYLGRVHFVLGDAPAASNALARAAALKATANATRFATNHQALLGLTPSFSTWPTRESPHFTFHFAPSLDSTRHPTYVEAHERAFQALTDFFGPVPPRKIHYFVWGRTEAKQAGIRLGFARPELGLIHTAVNQTLGHELTHVISHQALHPRRKTPFVNEGVAVAFDLSRRDRLAEAGRALAQAKLSEFPLHRLWTDWARLPEGVGYPLAGAWIDFLRRSGTKAELLEFVTDQTPEAAERIYGDRYPRWVAEFEARIHRAIQAAAARIQDPAPDLTEPEAPH